MAKWFLLMTSVSLVLTLCWAEMDCWNYLVSGPQGVPDAAFSVSSYYPFNIWHHNPACGRLYMYSKRNSAGCPAPNLEAWCSSGEDQYPYIQVEFSDLKKVVGVVVQHRRATRSGNDVRTYQVSYSENGEEWKYVGSQGVNQTFYVPSDSPEENTERHSDISPPIVARYFRIRLLTWEYTLPTPPCLRFDVIGCTHVVGTAAHVTGRRRFAYLPLPTGSINDAEIITQRHAKDLRECSLLCHRDVTCRSFSYSNAYKECRAYSVNRYNRVRSGAGMQTIFENQYLYYFDMTKVDLYMTRDPTSGLIYKVITRKYSKEDALAACADLEMRLLVVNSVDKLKFLDRVKSTSLILEQGAIRLSGGWYEVGGVTKWWDGGDPPQPLSDVLVNWDTATGYDDEECLVYKSNTVQPASCTPQLFSICEI